MLAGKLNVASKVALAATEGASIEPSPVPGSGPPAFLPNQEATDSFEVNGAASAEKAILPAGSLWLVVLCTRTMSMTVDEGLTLAVTGARAMVAAEGAPAALVLGMSAPANATHAMKAPSRRLAIRPDAMGQF
mgnify:CR=1 FL=1